MRPESGFATCRSPPIGSSPDETEFGTAIVAARATWAGREKVLHTALGILTSVGGFLEIGSLATAMWAGGSSTAYRLLWVLLLGTVAAISLHRDVGPLRGSQPAPFGDPRERQAGSR